MQGVTSAVPADQVNAGHDAERDADLARTERPNVRLG